ncbi:MAG: hypothetical protein DYH12_33100 [Sorangiineae bacterium PRO1]|nr:hypothetical protein [Sorangiineae bacterium PRO1]
MVFRSTQANPASALPHAVSPAEPADLQAPFSQRLFEPRQPLLHPPQCPGAVLVSTQPERPQVVAPSAQASVEQALPAHLPPLPQLLPQLPQCCGSATLFTHAVPFGVAH